MGSAHLGLEIDTSKKQPQTDICKAVQCKCVHTPSGGYVDTQKEIWVRGVRQEEEEINPKKREDTDSIAV